VTDLRLLVKDSSHANSEELIRGRVLLSILSTSVREKLNSILSRLTLIKQYILSGHTANSQLKTVSDNISKQLEERVCAVWATSIKEPIIERSAVPKTKHRH